jgi:hypothetical protein
MPRKFDFEAEYFKVVIPERDAWENIPADQEALVFYTDGSGKEGLVSMGIYGPFLRHFEALGTTPTIFQAEMYARIVWVKIYLNLEGISGKHIYIMSDSQAALRALKAHFQFQACSGMSWNPEKADPSMFSYIDVSPQGTQELK